MDDRIGKQLGNYRLLHLLGQGGFADVYLSEHIHLRTQAAIKVLQLRLVESNVQNFLQEARTIAHLVHPYIIRVLDFGVQDNTPFLVMDYAPKGTFRQRFLQGQQLPAMPLFPYIKQTAAALQYAHDNKLVHRDVKPENMLLGPNEEVLLSDFGFALIQSSISRSSMETAGTAAYMAPEQLQGKPHPASDQYALGIIAYEWLTGSCPFQGTFFEIASQHMLAVVPSLREKVPSISPEIESVVMIALAKDPHQRFPTVRDFAIALERACLATKVTHLDEPLVAPPFLNQSYRPLMTNTLSEDMQPMVSSSFASKKSPMREDVQYPFKPLSSVAFSQSTQVKMITSSETTRGGTWMNSSSLNDQVRQANLTALAPQSDLIRQSVQEKSMPASQAQHFPHVRPSWAAAEQGGQRGLPPSQQQQPSLSGMHALSTTEQVAPGQNYSQVRLSWAAAEQGGQRVQPSQQQQPSLSGMHALSTTEQSSHSLPPLSSISSETKTSHSQPSLAQHASRLSDQSWPGQTPVFPSKGAPLGVATKQPSSRRELSTEFRDNAQRYRRSGTSTSMIIFFLVMLVFIIGGGGGLIYWSSNQPSTPSAVINNAQPQNQVDVTATSSASLTATAVANATVTAQANINPYIAGASVLVMNDPLSMNNQTANWQENPHAGCQFTNGSYHVSAAINLFTSCFATGSNYTNFTYQIQMMFVQNAPKYSTGGIIFRSSTDQHQYYSFEVYASGRYIFQKCSNGNTNCIILAGSPLDPPVSAFHVGQTNTLAVVANQNTFTLYINQQAVGHLQTDKTSPYTQGMIGVLAHGGQGSSTPTEVAYSNIKLWE